MLNRDNAILAFCEVIDSNEVIQLFDQIQFFYRQKGHLLSRIDNLTHSYSCFVLSVELFKLLSCL